jgi:hypothetical protein
VLVFQEEESTSGPDAIEKCGHFEEIVRGIVVSWVKFKNENVIHAAHIPTMDVETEEENVETD